MVSWPSILLSRPPTCRRVKWHQLFSRSYLATSNASPFRRRFPPHVMASTRPTSRFSYIKFRVLIIGRANAGKTSILQRVCDTTESPVAYRIVEGRREQVGDSAPRPTYAHSPIRCGWNQLKRWVILSTHDAASQWGCFPYSEANTIFVMNWSSRTTKVTFSTTLADSRVVLKAN